MESSKVRQTFLDFFASKLHQIVPSAPMVVKDDPTLLFTNAGMNQFKDLFLGNKEAKYKRIADTQKCLRVSGKHNDLEEVGHDTYHHTMFEMLGNWSFGDYFKKDAIAWGWELLTEVYKLDKNRLYVTVFGGDEKENLGIDQEAFDYWKSFISEDRIIYGSKKDNFWEMGDTGPCGPCSEIHVDLREEADRASVPGKDLVNTGHPLVIEIWNLVFIEFNRTNDGSLTKLPARHVDTGMGFERLCMALQHKKSNYDTDVFQTIIQAIAQKCGMTYGNSKDSDVAMRVIADHLRAIAFAIADGQLPSNVKAGYVIRRILRRAVRYGFTFLNLKEPFIFELVPVLSHQMGAVFPELPRQKELIMNVIREEEAGFLRTLETGIQRFHLYVEKRATNTIDGKFAFELFDTYGFPVDLTQLMAREIGWEVDMEGFTKGMEEQKSRSKQAATTDKDDWTIVHPEQGGHEFIGYDVLQAEVKILRYRKVKMKENEFFQVVLDKTPFYAESGGQVGDRGTLEASGHKTTIENTIKENDLILHICRTLPSNPGEQFLAVVDKEKRELTANNHSATHLIHAALRQVLGTHVEQKGSLVDENRLRFDFTHFARVSKEEILRVEKLVNQKIRENVAKEENRSVPLDMAKEMGAMALFGEKYGETVRVITFGKDYSVELCGGTHVTQTGQIGMVKIISEGAIAAGIRRIEAITAEKAELYYLEQEELLENARELLKNPKDLLHGIKNMLEENHDLKKQVAEFDKLRALQIRDELIAGIEKINGIDFIARKIDLDSNSVKDLAFEMGKLVENLFLILANEADGKVNLTLFISEKLVKEKGLNAGTIIREVAKEVQGGGGGQPHIATAGGKNPAGIPAALAKAKSFIG
jgi:alanyl-tRNA synthetase